MSETLPADLKHNLRVANALDDNVNSINQKLQERTISNIVSYLQIMLLKLNESHTRSQKTIETIQTHDDLTQYTTFLSDGEMSSHDSGF